MAKKKPSKHSLKVEFIKQIVALSSSGFGLVAALAWNNVVQEIVNNYIKKFMPKDSGLISLVIYAILITALAVLITYQLSSLLRRVEN